MWLSPFNGLVGVLVSDEEVVRHLAEQLYEGDGVHPLSRQSAGDSPEPGEHVWAKPLKAAIARAGGMEIDNDWLRLDELVAMGLRTSLPLGDLDSEEAESPE